jgi:hypothetical protein
MKAETERLACILSSLAFLLAIKPISMVNHGVIGLLVASPCMIDLASATGRFPSLPTSAAPRLQNYMGSQRFVPSFRNEAGSLLPTR